MSRGCDRFSDSLKPAATLTITVSVSGSLVGTNSGITETVVFSGTVTKTFTRIPFDARGYYTDGTLPGVGEFYLLAKCCCAKCRFSLMFANGEAGMNSLSFTGEEIDWTSSATGPGAPPSDSGVNLLFGGWFNSFVEDSRMLFCNNDMEAGRTGQTSGAAITAIGSWHEPTFFNMPPLDWTFTDGTDSDGGSGASDLSFPGLSTLGNIAMDSCGDAQSWDASIVFNGTDTSGGTTSTVSAFTIGVNFSLG